MQIGGPIAMVFLILFVLFMIYDVSTSDGSELWETEFFAVLCADGEYEWEQPKCIEKVLPLRRTTPWQCTHWGMKKLQEWMQEYPGTKVKKWGCRKSSLPI